MQYDYKLERCANITSITLVKKLNLPTIKYHRPYKLYWLNKCRKVKMNKQVSISFSIKWYSDKVFCYVLHVHANHILLGRS